MHDWINDNITFKNNKQINNAHNSMHELLSPSKMTNIDMWLLQSCKWEGIIIRDSLENIKWLATNLRMQKLQRKY